MGKHSLEDKYWGIVEHIAATDPKLVDYLRRTIFNPAQVSLVEVDDMSEYLMYRYDLNTERGETTMDLCRSQIMADYYTIQQQTRET